MKKNVLTGLFILCALAMQAQPKLTKDNIDEVLGTMTLEEKATLLVGNGWGSMSTGSMTASATALVPGAAGTTRHNTGRPCRWSGRSAHITYTL